MTNQILLGKQKKFCYPRCAFNEMKKILLTLFLGLCLFTAKAVHIVGGEMEFIYLSDGQYRINLIQYFDEAQSSNPGPEAFATVYIFRNSDNAVISTHHLSLSFQEAVDYTNIACAIGRLVTSRVVWSSDVSLDPATYDDPEGYYIVWERCCRNTGIRNIVNPVVTGMKYVLDIPPLMIGGKIFVNSSPILFRPLSDYACINQLYYIEFTGVDPDGDSLAYSLTTPLNSSSVSTVPTPSPKPHLKVQFSSGFSESEMIPGNPPLRISNKGLLTVTPGDTGLYVFSVLVEEYRNQVKIGQTRRDFQMLVVDGCTPPDPPVVDVDIPGDPGFDPLVDVLTYTVADAKCFDFLVSNTTKGETITLRAEGVNFDDEFDDIFTLNQIPVVGSSSGQLTVEVCIPDCPPVRNEPFIVDLIAGDDACPLPQLDTLRLTIKVEPPPNTFPSPSILITNLTQPEDNNPIHTQTISATDADGDEMSMALFIEGIENPTLHGFDLDVTSSTAGNIAATFSWNTDCDRFDFSGIHKFEIAILIEDNDECAVPNPDTLFIDARIILPPDTDPVVTSSVSIPSQIELGNVLNFDVSVSDIDGDDVALSLIGGNFDRGTYGITFPSAFGNSNTSSVFSWDLSCNAGLYSDGQEFELFFIGDDDGRCKVKNFDTLKAVVQVNYPANTSPHFGEIERIQTIHINQLTQIEIEAFDLNIEDEITLSFAEGIRQPASASLVFEPVTGNGRVSSVLEWQPECSLLRLGETSTLQEVIFQVVDNACPISSIDTLRITFKIMDDQEIQREFLPPNVFTPNGDGVNDRFQLSGNVEQNQNLPENNCNNSFEYIVINNRTGNTVFRSENRDFSWSGGQFPEGVYYYLIKYTHTGFKGYIHILR